MLLKPISVKFCSSNPNEFCRDSRHYVEDLISWQSQNVERFDSNTPIFIVAADVKSLYPSLKRSLVHEALEAALREHAGFGAEACRTIVALNKLCLESLITQNGNNFFTQSEGIVTGDNHAVSLANITVHYVIRPIATILKQAELFRRFIDDIVWIATTQETNNSIKLALEKVFKDNCLELTFRQACTKDSAGQVEFLDINHCIVPNQPCGFITRDFIKPTAVGRKFINGISHHPKATFKSILYGESIRLRRLNEKSEDYQQSLQRLKDKALRSGFPQNMTHNMIELASTWEERLRPTSSKRKKARLCGPLPSPLC